jgi:phosphoglucomutase
MSRGTWRRSKYIVAEAVTKFSQRYVPTPLVAFGVIHFHASAGVMITASHNPARDNGYKVYWSNGAQINVPLDQHIAASILENQEPWDGAWDTTPDQNSPPVVPELVDAYVKRLKTGLEKLQPSVPAAQTAFHTTRSLEASVMYTPLHGVGTQYFNYVTQRVTRADRNVCLAQSEPDPDFPTLEFPNPEEEGALNLAFSSADAAKQSLVIANDPDADRFAAAQKMPDGSWHRFTGDQMGVLLASYLLDRVHDDQVGASFSEIGVTYATRQLADIAYIGDDGEMIRANKILTNVPPNSQRRVAMLTTAVSSGMLSRMARAHGVYFEETLTGFKWLGNRAHGMAPAFNVIFAYEEALGYMFPSVSYDKDGIAAASIFLNAVEYWISDNHKWGPMTPYEKLQSLYSSYGYHESINTHFSSHDPDRTKDFFNAIRESEEVNDMLLGRFRILRWRDVTDGIEHPTAPDPNAFATKLPMDPSSQMLTFHLQRVPQEGEADELREDLVTVTIRASGTEPKVKLYLECRSDSENTAQRLAGMAFQEVIALWWLEYGEEMRPASPNVKSSSGIMHETYTYVA